jgi:hypothetical protein
MVAGRDAFGFTAKPIGSPKPPDLTAGERSLVVIAGCFSLANKPTLG